MRPRITLDWCLILSYSGLLKLSLKLKTSSQLENDLLEVMLITLLILKETRSFLSGVQTKEKMMKHKHSVISSESMSKMDHWSLNIDLNGLISTQISPSQATWTWISMRTISSFDSRSTLLKMTMKTQSLNLLFSTLISTRWRYFILLDQQWSKTHIANLVLISHLLIRKYTFSTSIQIDSCKFQELSTITLMDFWTRLLMKKLNLNWLRTNQRSTSYMQILETSALIRSTKLSSITMIMKNLSEQTLILVNSSTSVLRITTKKTSCFTSLMELNQVRSKLKSLSMQVLILLK